MMKYLVAMSGGVDSSVSAVKLKKEGHEVIGVHILFWAEDQQKNKCCDESDMVFAHKVAVDHDIPFFTMDFTELFKEKIVDDAFLKIYEEGMTPSPCVSCNKLIKFGALLEEAKKFSVDKICTGHYAKVEEDAGEYSLRAGKDKSKDQSYFLHRLTQDQLGEIYFPLEDMTKEEVMELGKEWKLINENRTKTESQDLCFIPEKTPEPFLKRHLDQRLWKEGDIFTDEGEKVGEHRGLPFYTIGQRKGLDIGGLEEPLYVIGKDEQNNKLFVGKKEEGSWDSLTLRNLNIIPKDFDESKTYDLTIRYAGKPHKGIVKRIGESYSDDYGELFDAEVGFEEEIQGITPGQYLVIYDGEYCLGGGEIS